MSHLGKTLRIAAKAKAQARVGKAIRARKAYLPELHEAQKAIKKVKARDDGGKVDGVQAQVRSDRKPRAAKAWGGSLTPEEVDAALAAVQQNPGIASQIAGAYSPAIGSVANAARMLTGAGIRRLIGAPEGELAPVQPQVSQARPQPYRAEGTVNVTPAATRIPRGAPRATAYTMDTLAQAAVDGADRAAEPRGTIIASRPERRPAAADMVVTAPRPAAAPARVPRETLNADRLNAISAGQSRVGPPAADEVPRGSVEEAAARNMAARRALIESTPTVGGVEGTFKRGGKAKAKKKAR